MLKTVVMLNLYIFKNNYTFLRIFEEIESSKNSIWNKLLYNLNASFPNKCITFLQKIADFGNVDYVIKFDALIQFSVSEEHHGNAPIQSCTVLNSI